MQKAAVFLKKIQENSCFFIEKYHFYHNFTVYKVRRLHLRVARRDEIATTGENLPLKSF
jgi:hypothetical protein